MATGAQLTQQLQQELQNELTTSNQLLRLISVELQQIKQITSSSGELEANIKKSASLMTTLASIQQVDIENLPPPVRQHSDLNHESNDVSYIHSHEMFRDSSYIDENQ